MKLTITGSAAAIVGFTATAAVGFAGVAQADPPLPPLLNGVYSGAQGDPYSVWTINTSCGPTGCTGSVASNQGWTSPTSYADGRWNFTVTKPDGVICTDGRYEPAVISLSIDPVTLAGVVSADSNYGCPGGILSQTPFQLLKVG